VFTSALQEQLYRVASTRPGDKASPARAGTAFSRVGAVSAGLIFLNGLWNMSGATHALQDFLKSHMYQEFQANMGHFSTSSGKTYCSKCIISLSRAVYLATAAAFATQASLCCLDLLCCLKSLESFHLRSTGAFPAHSHIEHSRCSVAYHLMSKSTVGITEPTAPPYSWH
jgi:hypothetical protein